MRLSLKLAALFAAAALLPLITAAIFVLREASSSGRARATDSLQMSARAAASIYEKRLDEMRSAAQRLAVDIANRALVSSSDAERDSAAAWTRLQDMLPRAQKELFLDFLIITDPAGRVIARHNDKPAPNETVLDPNDKNLVAERVISEGLQLRNSPAASAAREGEQQVARLALETVARVEGRDGRAVNEALMIEAAAPIFSAGRFVGAVLIGQMLNTYYAPRAGASALQMPLVAEARQALFRGTEKDAGVLIALGDTIIASNLPLAEATGALDPEPALKGAKCDTSRGEEVIADGERRYAVSWQPIKSLDGAQLGAIGVAIAASEIEGAADPIRTMLVIISAVAVTAAGLAGFFFGRALGLRIEALAESAHRMSLGELSTPVKDPLLPQPNWFSSFLSSDEIARLAARLDEMRDSFRQAIERLRKR